MANYDTQMAQRVWKRVQGAKEEPKNEPRELNIQGLIMNERMAAASYQQLARQMGSREAAVLQRMAREEQAHGVCLRGMYTMMTGERPVCKAPQMQSEPAELALRKAYAGELRSIADYEARSDHPEYGHIFAAMARQEREHSRLVLELLGGLHTGSL